MIVRQVEKALHSRIFKRRIDRIHEFYPNLKSEFRYRDALLEVFNAMQWAIGSDLIAYAEADKVDMVVTHAGSGASRNWLRIEFKYHFTYDIAHRVAPKLELLEKLANEDDALAALEGVSPRDLPNILLDCLPGRKGAGAADDTLCDLFVLVVQDRRRAQRPVRLPATRSKRCQPIESRGVIMQFLHEQVNFDAACERDAEYDSAWREPLHKMFEEIYRRREFRLLPPVMHKVRPMHHNIPLTSHLFALDFTQTAELPKSASTLFAFARQTGACD